MKKKNNNNKTPKANMGDNSTVPNQHKGDDIAHVTGPSTASSTAPAALSPDDRTVAMAKLKENMDGYKKLADKCKEVVKTYKQLVKIYQEVVVDGDEVVEAS